jgi:hypothetical protein
MEQLLVTIKARVNAAWPVAMVEDRTDKDGLPVTTSGVLEIDQAKLLSQIGPYAYGMELGRALFATPALRDVFARARRSSRGRLRLLLVIEASDLTAIHWERLCVPVDDDRWAVAAIDQRFVYSRYLPSPNDQYFQPFGRRQLRVLLLVASPTNIERYNLQPFDPAPVVAGLRQAIGPAHCDLLADTPGAVGPPTLEALCARLAERFYPIVHVVGHGRISSEGEPTLYLADESGQTDPVGAARLIERLGQVGGQGRLPHLIFLMSCASAMEDVGESLGGMAQRMVGHLGIPAVVAMTDRVSQPTAQTLSEGFYPHLRRSGEVDRALCAARLKLAARPDATVAMLYGRLGGRPLFSRPRWPIYAAASVVVLVLALVLAFKMTDPEIFAHWLADRLEWTLAAPRPDLPEHVVVAYSAQPPTCLDLPGLVADVGRTTGLDVESQNDADALASPGAGKAWFGVEVSCPPGGPISATVALTSTSPLPINLLQEPERLSYNNASNARVKAFVHSALLYSLGSYDNADQRLTDVAQDEGDNDVAWLRGNLALRGERWQEADEIYKSAEHSARPELRVILEGNRLLNTVQLLRSGGFSHNSADTRLFCESANMDQIHSLIAAASLPDLQQRVELNLIGVVTLFYCPVEGSGDIPLIQEELKALYSLVGDDHKLASELAAIQAQMDTFNLEDPLLIQERACLALDDDVSSVEMRRVLGIIYAQTGLNNIAREQLLKYEQQAPLAWQRREALELRLLTGNWPQDLKSPFPVSQDLGTCPNKPSILQ